MQSILVVDDDRDNLELLKYILEREGINVHCAECGEDALRRIKLRPFLLMITDLNMPGLNGFALAKKARGMAPRMQIVMSTGDKSPEIARLALEAGIAKVLAKPFLPKELLEIVREVVGKRGKGANPPEKTAKGGTGDRSSWICPCCRVYYEGWSSRNICYKCGYTE